MKCGVLSDVFIQDNGLVQGGAPILFNVAINDIFYTRPHFQSSICGRLLYVDSEKTHCTFD